MRVRIGDRRGDGFSARLLAIESASPDRVAPPCPHAGACGGCTLQHLADAAYAAWKRGLAEAALARAGFASPPLDPLARSAPGTRRRAELSLRRADGRVIVGFHGRASAEVVDIPGCLVLHPALLAIAASLRSFLPRLGVLKREGKVWLTLAAEGVDLWLTTDGAADAAARSALAEFARVAGLARLSWSLLGHDPDPVAVLATPTVSFAGVPVRLPPGGFLQATEDGERAIVSAVLAALADLPEGARVADLYAGSGTLTFPLARRFRVLAVEGDRAASAALRSAAQAAALSGRVVVERRDLSLRPIAGRELDGLEAVVLDPPRDGARAQAAALAEGPVRRVVYVSCNPAALARDARLLAQAGFRLDRAVPIDQFLWSAHLECVASFSR